MNRRSLLLATGSICAVSLAGCLGDDSTAGDESAQEGSFSFGNAIDDQPTLSVRDTQADQPVTDLDARIRGVVFDRLEANEQFWEPPAGSLYVLVQAAIENVGTESLSFAGGYVSLVDSAGSTGDWTVLLDGSRLQVDIDPGGQFDEWLVFTVDEDISSLEISIEPQAPVTVSTTLDPSLEFTFPET